MPNERAARRASPGPRRARTRPRSLLSCRAAGLSARDERGDGGLVGSPAVAAKWPASSER